MTPSFGYSNYLNTGCFFRNNYNNIYNSNFFNNDMKNKERSEFNSIIGIGDCIVDIITEINEQIINSYHLENDKTKYIDENNKNIFKELEAKSQITYVPGGSVQNILRVLSYILHEKSDNNNNNFNSNINININLGIEYKLSMLGCLGEDVYKDKIINSLKYCKINPLLKFSNGETSRCAACFYNKKPYLISEIKASKNLDKEFIVLNKDNILKHQILLIEGYYIQYNFEVCLELCESFKRQGNKLIILILSPISLNIYLYEKFISIANYADIIFSSKNQAEELANSKGEIDNKIIFEKIFKKLTDNANRLIVIKNGKEAAYCSKYNYKEKHLEFILTSFPQQIKTEEIKDEIGFEDAFFGGFLSEYMKGKSLYLCLKKGNDIANIVLKNPGCTFERKR